RRRAACGRRTSRARSACPRGSCARSVTSPAAGPTAPSPGPSKSQTAQLRCSGHRRTGGSGQAGPARVL
ncbi:Cathepsin Z, partial [Nocardioides sp. PD653]